MSTAGRRIARLLRTSAFRLSLLYAGLTLTCVVLMFAGVFFAADRFMAGQIDQTVSNEISEILTTTRTDDGGNLAATVARMARESPGIEYLLENRNGGRVAGNLPALPPRTGIYEPRWHLRRGSQLTLRGRGLVVADGRYLFVGLNRFALDALLGALARAFVLGGGVALLLALVCGLWMSARLMRRVEDFNRTGRAFIEGAFEQRIALSGNADEFDQLGTSLNEIFDQIQTLMSELRQVTNDIAHDLRTPLGRLRQSLERALAGGGETALRAALQTAIGEADAILETFAALLRIAQIEAGTRRAGFTHADLSALLGGLLETYQIAADARGQMLGGHIDTGLSVRGDPQLLTQLTVNLLDNALTHCPAPARIRLDAARVADGIAIIVTDNGPGIPEPLLAKVFQRFFRVDPSRHDGGNGLGLTLAAAVAHLHQGSIALRNMNPGLEVTVTLPTGV